MEAEVLFDNTDIRQSTVLYYKSVSLCLETLKKNQILPILVFLVFLNINLLIYSTEVFLNGLPTA